MYKRKDDEESDKKFRRTVTRNWILCGVSLALALLCLYCFK